LYLRGMYFWNRRGPDNLRGAISYFEQAVASDPKFGRAYAGIASAYALLPEYTDSPPKDVLDRTRNAATRALQIDSGLAQAHTALGLASVHAWDYETAENQYRMAIELEPRYATAHQWYGEMLYKTDRVDSAIAEIRRAIELDPLAPITASALGYALDLAGRCDEGIAEIKKGIEIASTVALNHVVLSYCYYFNRDYPSAVREIETAARLAPDLAVQQGMLAYMYGATGDKQRARSVLSRLEQRSRTEHVGSYSIALAKIGLGDNDGALTALEHAVDEHDIALSLFSIPGDRVWTPVRQDPRFQRILERMNLAPYVTRAR
jgi:tetratricopeptide (TPR) repeat protein